MPRLIRTHWHLPACLALLLLHAFLSWTAVSRESATYDEPLEIVSSWTALHLHDFRTDYEHPPLWKYFAALPTSASDLHLNPTDPRWSTMGSYEPAKWSFTLETLYRDPANHPRPLLTRMRAMMLLLSLSLGALIAFWTYHLAKTLNPACNARSPSPTHRAPLASVIATAFYCLDPNFLAHGPLVKNDVPVTLASTAVLYLTWQLGQRITLRHTLLLGLVTGLALCTKLSAILLAPIIVLLLLTRALLPTPWSTTQPAPFTVLLRRPCRRRISPSQSNPPLPPSDAPHAPILATRPKRLLAAAAILLSTLALSYLTLWAVYGFRYAASPDPAYHIDTSSILQVMSNRARAAGDPHFHPSPATELLLSLNTHHLLPEAWVCGLLFTQRTGFHFPSYLMGVPLPSATWYYFPLTLLLKTPTATLLALALLPLTLLRARTPTPDPTPPFGRPARGARLPLDPWSLLTLLLPPALPLLLSLFTSINLGIRYLLPLYPPLFILIALAATSRPPSPRPPPLLPHFPTSPFLLLLPLLLAETLWHHPHYIPFFNTPATAIAPPLYWLSDSNLDWGQDLPLLADWQRAHPDADLYLAYFGTEDPALYDIRYHPLLTSALLLPGGTPAPPNVLPNSVFAISATDLQGAYLPGDPYRPFRTTPPDWVLGGSIYLYRVEPGATR